MNTTEYSLGTLGIGAKITCTIPGNMVNTVLVTIIKVCCIQAKIVILLKAVFRHKVAARIILSSASLASDAGNWERRSRACRL